MSLKLAVVGSLLGTLGTRARSDDKARNLEPVGTRCEPILTIFGRRSSPAEPEKPDARQAVDGKRELRD